MWVRALRNPSLTPAPLQDFREILRWTTTQFGTAAAARYKALIKQAIRDIGADRERPGSQTRSEVIVTGARTYHLSFSRNRVPGLSVKAPRHFLLYRQLENGELQVARILHDSRDFDRHIPADYRTDDSTD